MTDLLDIIQPDLFDTAPWSRSGTSKEAARDIAEHLNRLAAEVLAAIGDGSTCDEIEVRLEMRHQTASARLNELERRGLVRNSGTKRRTRSGRLAMVYERVPR